MLVYATSGNGGHSSLHVALLAKYAQVCRDVIAPFNRLGNMTYCSL